MCAIVQMASDELIYDVHIGGRMRTAHFHFYDGNCLEREIEERPIANYAQWESPSDGREVSHCFKLRVRGTNDLDGVHYDEITWG